MTMFTEEDLRVALDADATAGAPPVDVWSRLQRRRTKQQRLRAGLALAGAVAVAATVVITRPGHDEATVIPPVTSNVPTLVPDRSLSTAEVLKAVDSFRHRVDSLGVNRATISTRGDAVLIDASGTTRSDIAAIAVRGELQFRSVTGAQAGANGETEYQLGPIALDNSDVAGAEVVRSPQTDEWLVQVSFDREGRQKFETLTADAAAQPDTSCSPDYCHRIAIVLDGTVLSAPLVLREGGVTSGQAEISNDHELLTKEQAQTLVALATSDPLPSAFHLSD